MRLSTKGRYAVTAMLELAIQEGTGPVTLAEISRCQGISLSYLEQLFARLRRKRLVRGVRGPGGGYRLARAAQTISVAEVIAAVDGRAELTPPRQAEECRDSTRFLTHKLWGVLSDRIYSFLDRVTLADLVTDDKLAKLAQGEERQRGNHPSEDAVAA